MSVLCSRLYTILALSIASCWTTLAFKTEPFLVPTFNVSKSGKPLAPGYLFITPSSYVYEAAQILTNDGELVWSSQEVDAYDLKTQKLDGEDVLLFWNGTGSPGGVNGAGHGAGQVNILASNYTLLHSICPHFGLVFANNQTVECQADLHEAYITEKGSILVTAYNATQADLTGVTGANGTGWVFDSLFFEIDIKSGEILFSWSALKAGVPVSSSFLALGRAGTPQIPYDFFHINSIQPVGDGYLIGSRNTWNVLKLDKTGKVEWEFQGNDGGDFKLPPGIHFAWQHQPRIESFTKRSLTLSLFDDANSTPPLDGVNQTLGLQFHLDLETKTATLLKKLYDSSDAVYTETQGSYQPLSNGNTVLGYGSVPRIKEFGPAGDVRLSITFAENNTTTTGTDSYRAFKQQWYAIPAADPKVVAENGTAYVSWNGATNVTSWVFYEGASESALVRTKKVKKHGFETSVSLKKSAKYVKAGAFDGKTFLRNSSVVEVS